MIKFGDSTQKVNRDIMDARRIGSGFSNDISHDGIIVSTSNGLYSLNPNTGYRRKVIPEYSKNPSDIHSHSYGDMTIFDGAVYAIKYGRMKIIQTNQGIEKVQKGDSITSVHLGKEWAASYFKDKNLGALVSARGRMYVSCENKILDVTPTRKFPEFVTERPGVIDALAIDDNSIMDGGLKGLGHDGSAPLSAIMFTKDDVLMAFDDNGKYKISLMREGDIATRREIVGGFFYFNGTLYDVCLDGIYNTLEDKKGENSIFRLSQEPSDADIGFNHAVAIPTSMKLRHLFTRKKKSTNTK
jgi:outer membrane protein assembly factor BamB